MAAELLFIHSSFRTASTWLWAKFRQPGVLALCEPFNEFLGEVTLDNIEDRRPDSWQSGHPETGPYFIEYAPLVGGIGVKHYKSDFAFERFIPTDGLLGKIESDEEVYLKGLVKLGQRSGQLPVLGCTRSLGRAFGIKQALGGSHIFLYRPLLDQWLSYWSQFEAGQPYFLQTVGRTVCMNCGRVPLFDRLANRLWVGEDVPGNIAGFTDLEAAFEAFLASHLYLYSAAHKWADLVISTRQLAADPRYARETEAQLFGLSQLRLSLSDATRNVAKVHRIGITAEAIDRATRYAQHSSSDLTAMLLAELRTDFALLATTPDAARLAIEDRDRSIAQLQAEVAAITTSKRYQLASRLAAIWNAFRRS